MKKMAYKKLDKYTVKNNPDVQDMMLQTLLNREIDGKLLPTKTARRLVFNPPSMSKLRWSNYLTIKEMSMFLCLEGCNCEDALEVTSKINSEENEDTTEDITEEVIDDFSDVFDIDLGI